MKRYLLQKKISVETQTIGDIRFVVADKEKISILKHDLYNPSHKNLTAASVEKLYREQLLKLGMEDEDLYNFYRKYLEPLMLENVPGIPFEKYPGAIELKITRCEGN